MPSLCGPPPIVDVHGARSPRHCWRRERSRHEAWPSRSVRYVNGFPAGGATDTLSRIICQRMSELSGQSFVVENKGGAGGCSGGCCGEIAARRLHGRARRHRHQRARDRQLRQASLSPRGDFTFIAGMWQLPNILSASKDLFSSDLKELSPRSRRSRRNTPTPPPASAPRCISGEMMNSMAGVEVRHVPYKGAGAGMNDLLGGASICCSTICRARCRACAPARFGRSRSPR